MADDKQLDALYELERRSMSGDPAITPQLKEQITSKLDAYRAQGLAKPLATPDAGKPLPAWAATPFEQQIGIFGGVSRGIDTFKDEFSGNPLTGGLENKIQGMFSGFGSEGQRDWWAQFGSTDNVIRNDLFGAALTESEKAAYAATTVTPSMDPKEVRRNLTSRRDILQGALSRRANFLKAQGYSKDAIEALSGEFAEQIGANVVAPAVPPPPGAPATAVATPPGGARPIDPEGVGDIGFASKASAEANSLPEGAQVFQRELQERVNAGEFTTPGELVAFAKGRNFDITADQAKAAIESIQAGRGVGVATPTFAIPKVDERREGSVFSPVGRGVADVASLGLFDEGAAAAQTIFGEGTMRENLARQRAIDEYDVENTPLSRLTGQVVGGLALPSRIGAAGATAREAAIAGGEAPTLARLAGARAMTRRGALESGAYGAGYGFGSGEGMSDRLTGAATSGVTGLALGAGLGKLSEIYTGRRGGGLPGGGAPDAPPAQPAPRDVFSAAQRQGIEVMPADVGGTGTRMASGATAMTLGGIPMAEAAERSIASAAGARSRIAGTAGVAADEAGAGQAIQRGAEAFMDVSQKRAAKLYDAIPIGGDRPAVVNNTRGALSELTRGMESNPELSRLVAENPRLKSYLSALTPKPVEIPVPPRQMPGGAPIPQPPVIEMQGGQLSWQDLKRFRSAIGEIIGQPGLAEDTSTASLRRLYGALSSDMEATATAAGPKALDSWKKADRYWRGRQDRIENVLSDVLGKNYRKGEESAFAQIERWARPGGDASRLGRAMRSLPKEEADTVRATIIDRLGTASKGQQDDVGSVFSPAQFVTQWNNLAPRAKAILFNDPGLRSALDDLATVTAGMKGAQKFANVSRTGNAVNGIALLSSLFASPLATAGIAGAQLGAGKLLSSQWMVRQLTRGARQAIEGVPQHQVARDMLKRISSGAARNPGIANEIGQFEQALLRVANDNASAGGRVAAQEEGRQKNQ